MIEGDSDMGVDSTTTLNAILSVLALVSAGLAALLFGSLKALRDSNTDLRDRVADQDVRIIEMATEIVTLKNDRDALQRIVRADAELASIMSKLDSHHEEAETHWETELALLTEIRDFWGRATP